MTLSDSVGLAALAGLLHDVGKFGLRAATGSDRAWDETAAREFEYPHAMASARLAERYVPAPWREAVAATVGRHHQPRPDQTAAWAVALADILSAAGRDDMPGEEERIHQPHQLRTIFAHLTADEEQLDAAAHARAYLPLQALALDQTVLFPGPELAADTARANYVSLFSDFEKAAAELGDMHQATPDLDTYVESMALLLQRYTWAVPSAYYGSVLDSSLYDHSRTTAASAAVLTASGHEASTLKEWVDQPQTETELALLVGADLSGVQDFIYTITSRGATSALRGRSFYLQMLTEAAARWVLRALDLPITNLLYVGGGNFYVLAAPHHIDRLVEAQQHISRALLQHHRGDLYLALAHVPLAGKDFFDGCISQAWQRLAEQLQSAKLCRFAELEPDDQTLLFAPQEDGGNTDRQCQVCGLEHPHTTERDGVYKCPACLSYEELGRDLRRARFLLLEEVEPSAIDLAAAAGDYASALAALGLRITVGDRRPPIPPGRATLLALDDAPVDELQPQPHLAVGRRFLVNTAPVLSEAGLADLRRDRYPEDPDDEPLRAGQVKPFSVLAWESQGIQRLGVLRMDVDNLGRLFAEGLGERATLARVASLSLAVSLYFEGWVAQIAREYGERLYSIYSGGDDLFFVGAWDAVIEFARHVRADFTPYVAHHPGLHLSAGVVLAGRKYPLAQAAREAGSAEEQAKRYQHADGRRKDAVSFLGAVQPWQRFGLEAECAGGVSSVHALAHLLLDMVDPSGGGAHVPKSLLGNLVQLYDQYRVADEERRQAGRDLNRAGAPQALWGPWMWRGVYMLSRMADRLKTQPHLQRQVQELQRNLEQEEFRNMDWIGLAARWAELLSR